MPRLSHRHPDAICPRLTINDLFLFRDLFQGLRNGRGMKEVASELRISLKKCRELLRAVEKALEIDDQPPGFIRSQAGKKDVELTPAGIFHAGISDLVDRLMAVVDDCQTRGKHVVVQGSEFSTLWLLPRVLERSRFLEQHPDVVLDIRRAFWHRFVANLEQGRIDLAIGPDAPHRPPVKQTHLLTVPRAIIFHKNHEFACGKPPEQIGIEDLGRETVFVLSGEPVPGFKMKNYLPKPSHGGRHIYIDSIAHVYQYVQRDLGVSLGYEYDYGPAHEKSLVVAKALGGKESRIPPRAILSLFPA